MMMMMFKNKRLALTRTEDEEQKPKKHGCFACLTVYLFCFIALFLLRAFFAVFLVSLPFYAVLLNDRHCFSSLLRYGLKLPKC